MHHATRTGTESRHRSRLLVALFYLLLPFFVGVHFAPIESPWLWFAGWAALAAVFLPLLAWLWTPGNGVADAGRRTGERVSPHGFRIAYGLVAPTLVVGLLLSFMAIDSGGVIPLPGKDLLLFVLWVALVVTVTLPRAVTIWRGEGGAAEGRG